MKKIYLAVLLLVCMTLLNACGKQTDNTQNTTTGTVGVGDTNTRQTVEDSGYGLGLYGNTHQKVSNQHLYFNVSGNENLNGNIEVTNKLEKDYRFLLTAFVDYKQQEISLDSKTQVDHYLDVSKDNKFSVPFSLMTTEGMHDISVILIKDPEEKSTGYFLPNERIASRRAVVKKVDNQNFNALQKTDLGQMDKGFDKIGVISAVNKEGTPVTSINTGTPLTLNLNLDAKINNFVLMAINNGKQMPLTVNGREDIAFYCDRPAEPALLPVELKTVQPGQLFFILSPNPYTLKENEKGELDKELTWQMFFSSKIQVQ